MGECAIYEGIQPVGRLAWNSDGLRWHFQAKIKRCEGVRYLWLTDARGAQLRLGVPQPMGEEMVLNRTLTRQGLAGVCPDESCRAELRSRDAPLTEPEAKPDPAPDERRESCEQPDGVQERRQAVVYRENGILYVGEPFETNGELLFSPVFQKMVFREIDGSLHWLLPLG